MFFVNIQGSFPQFKSRKIRSSTKFLQYATFCGPEIKEHSKFLFSPPRFELACVQKKWP